MKKISLGKSEFRHYLRPEGRGIRLHLGCGDFWFEGYINIDHGVYGGTDMIFDIREKLPFQDEVVEVIEAHDVIEHFNKYELDKMLPDWKRLLIEGGQIFITTPDFNETVKQYNQAEKKDKMIEKIFGVEDNPGHKWGFTESNLRKLFEKYGFRDIIIESVELDYREGEPKLKLICKK